MNTGMRGASRTLEVLRALNLNNGASIVELNRATGISRPALYRIVRALCDDGYLRFDPGTDGYLLTPLVRQLSDGFSDDAWISDIASPVLDQLQQQVIWPTDLFTFHSDRMIMRRTTRRASPWTIDNAMVGLGIPVLITAVGRAYLAHQRREIQEGVIERLAKSDHADSAIARNSATAMRMLNLIAKDGFATRDRTFMPNTGSIAVPVLINGYAAGSIAITYISSALRASEAKRRYLVSLTNAAKLIAAQLSEDQRARSGRASKHHS
jgi:IclR family transcriptional regulator, mhp operon transcriptional activator